MEGTANSKNENPILKIMIRVSVGEFMEGKAPKF